MAKLKPIIRRPKASEDVESHAMYIADGSMDAALRFIERAEQTIKGLALFPQIRRARRFHRDS
ncbi:type II toxin-antitoxin system RelE/ParE family toxin [Rosistilla oblonga]|uniref:type II toxin-antitoxin system RelE/ParE family toxin n=1 Tax=Rosistilla oblonga TaxID=2527990 RepID=UPI003B82E198